MGHDMLRNKGKVHEPIVVEIKSRKGKALLYRMSADPFRNLFCDPPVAHQWTHKVVGEKFCGTVYPCGLKVSPHRWLADSRSTMVQSGRCVSQAIQFSLPIVRRSDFMWLRGGVIKTCTVFKPIWYSCQTCLTVSSNKETEKSKMWDILQNNWSEPLNKFNVFS